MSDAYRLVFRGEVLEGQHPAVVRKRLGSAAGFKDAQLDKLFSGQPVILKREADTSTAARLQALFKQAGARLRVLPLDAGVPSSDSGAAGTGTGDAGSAPAAGAAAEAQQAEQPGTFEVLPVGSDLLGQDERKAFVPREVDTSALSLEGARFSVPEAAAAPAGPDVSHLTLAESGSPLAEPSAEPAAAPAPDYDLADVGVDLGQIRVPVQAPIDVDGLDFELAPAGTVLARPRDAVTGAVPDTSQLTLAPLPADPDDG